MSEKCIEERVGRDILENQLLVSLSNKNKVAILLDKADLELLISGLVLAETNRMAMGRHREFRQDLEQLKKVAFV